MKIFKLKYSQKLPISLNEAWDFLSSPSNLELITPKSMDFNITDYDKKKAYPGQIFTVFFNFSSVTSCSISNALDVITVSFLFDIIVLINNWDFLKT